MMEKIDILIFVVSIGLSFQTALILVMWNNLNNRIDKLDEKFEGKIDKLDVKITDIDKRVFSIENMLHMKDCCLLKDQSLKKAE